LAPTGRQANKGDLGSTESSFPSLNEEKCCLCSILGTPLMQKYLRTKKEAGILNLSVLARLSELTYFPSTHHENKQKEQIFLTFPHEFSR